MFFLIKVPEAKDNEALCQLKVAQAPNVKGAEHVIGDL